MVIVKLHLGYTEVLPRSNYMYAIHGYYIIPLNKIERVDGSSTYSSYVILGVKDERIRIIKTVDGEYYLVIDIEGRIKKVSMHEAFEINVSESEFFKDLNEKNIKLERILK